MLTKEDQVKAASENIEFFQTGEYRKGRKDSQSPRTNGDSFFVYDTAIGKMTITDNGEAVTSVHYGVKEEPAEYCRTGLTDCAAAQLEEYFAGKRRGFDVPLFPTGTPFQKLVWNALQSIPYGETRSYKQIAEMIGKPRACRAVGMANNKNPILIMIPCHRVVGSNGSLVGFAAGLQIKERLLTLEKENLCKQMG